MKIFLYQFLSLAHSKNTTNLVILNWNKERCTIHCAIKIVILWEYKNQQRIQEGINKSGNWVLSDLELAATFLWVWQSLKVVNRANVGLKWRKLSFITFICNEKVLVAQAVVTQNILNWLFWKLLQIVLFTENKKYKNYWTTCMKFRVDQVDKWNVLYLIHSKSYGHFHRYKNIHCHG